VRVKKRIRIAAAVLGILLVAATAIALAKIGPRNVWGMIRYDQRREGSLAVGDAAPDVVLTALDGNARVRLHERLGGRPAVLIFGSYT
jgi:hypothetical protein